MSTLDRKKAKAVFRQRYIEHTTVDQALDYLEKCVRPVEGIILTPEERDRVTGWFVKLGEPATEVLPEDRALFKRLESA